MALTPRVEKPRGRGFRPGPDPRRNVRGRPPTAPPTQILERLDQHALRAREAAQAAAETEWNGPTLSALARRHTAQVVELWTRVLNDEGLPVNYRLTAADALSARAWGKPSQEVAVSVSRGADIQQLSRDALFAALQRAAEREQIALPVLPGASGHLPAPIDVTPRAIDAAGQTENSRDVMRHDLTVERQDESHGRGSDVSARVAKPGKGEVSDRG